jgi:peroxiredoxin Q/BCP
VSFDPPEKSRAFAEKFDFPYPLLPDVSREIGLLYGAAPSSTAPMAHRIAFLIDEQGRVVEAHRRVDPLTYPREQLERIVLTAARGG